MFGILYLLVSGISREAIEIKNNIDDNTMRIAAKNNKDITYYSSDGLRLVSNNRRVYRKYINGDDVLVDLYNGEIYKNYSKEKRNEKEYEAKIHNKTVINVHYDELQEYNKTERFKAKTISITPSYRDIKTHKFYISVCLNGLVFYMDIISGNLIRLKDDTDTTNKWGDLTVEEIMTIFNKRQRELYEIPKEQYDYIWWEKHFYLKNTGFNILFIDNNGKIIEGDYKRNPEIRRIRKQLINGGINNE